MKSLREQFARLLGSLATGFRRARLAHRSGPELIVGAMLAPLARFSAVVRRRPKAARSRPRLPARLGRWSLRAMLAVLAVWSVCLWVVGAEAMGGGWAASVELGAAQLAALAVVLAIPSHLAHTVVMLWGRLRWPAAMAVQVAMAERSDTIVLP